MSALTLTDLFCGAGGSSTGAIQVPGVTVRAASNHWQLAVDTHNTNHPDADHICADLSQIDPRYFPTTDILWASPECFTAGHLVTTQRGQVRIENVRVGDMALTHKGRWQPVVRIQHRNNVTVVRVTGSGHPGITVTPNHRFWVKSSDRAWNGNGYTRRYGVADWMRVDRMLTNEALWATPITATAPGTEPADLLPPVFAASAMGEYLLGRWLGDGSLSFGRNHEVTISCGYHEADELEAILGDTGVRWHRSEKRTAVVFTASDLKSRDWLDEHCGHGAANKQAPSWAISMHKEYRAGLLDGYMAADGGTTQRRHRASTISRALAVSMRLIAESLGHRVAMAHDNRTTYSIEGRTGAAQQQWILHWEPQLSAQRAPEAFTDDLHAWSRVRRIEQCKQAATVYNIEVANDHSYVLDGIVVANCTNHSIAKGKRRATNQLDIFGEGLPDEAAQRSRATMWDVPRFTEVHGYQSVIVENVVDAANWVPFQAWLMAMDSLGYHHQIVWLNSMHAWALGAPAPQSRDRMYVVFWRKGNRKPDLERMQRPPAWCPTHGRVEAMQSFKNPAKRWGRYRAQYVYRCPQVECRNQIVDPAWLPAASIIDWSDTGTRIGDRPRPLAEKTIRRIQAGIDRYWAQPSLVPVEGREGKAPMSVSDPIRTMTTRNETGLLVPAGGSDARTTSEALSTVTASGNHHALVTSYYGNGGSTTTHAALPTVSTRDHHALIMRNFGQPAGGEAHLSTPAHEPTRTITTAGHQSLVTRGQTIEVEDCNFRMLTPSEIQQAMAFDRTYVLLGNKREKVRMAGNAVTPPAARDLVGAVSKSLEATA